MTFYVCRNRVKWHDESFRSKIGTVLDGTKGDQAEYRAQVAVLPLFFLTRRLITAVSLVWWRDFFFGQVTAQYFCCICMLTFLQVASPLESQSNLRLETFNEAIILGILYLLVCFTHFQPDVNRRNDLGFVYIGVICFFTAEHFGLLSFTTGKNVHALVKTNWQQRKMR
mmetsp:Transcript_38996/g.51030  ORF Transcript_38996/g.51030 Transcript_38996/m.51030 type:complete len:169 (+) Transcript_38996:1526-2032(+)|eukprot:CAMPEP_0185614322 /NCGR_PEP_ID=MMETSP0436-20130131/31163_1 /TAXON_ID=626734 ORGANISM="Favella taraikaensis, Strain Fe Narragansett Bay" /NCGR_SAMPLE_ID=MMETSP0436 /ASSEMBLY_ACC=CAM_ASM_000390 /LENGTH=168 /DNA_ID=CAMNT_0028249045 /DNA_START=420 /DNA_END=926 /DNA_ORIENTATION=-